MCGALYIIGVGPGDPELVTVKGAAVLGSVKNVFVPVSGEGRESLAYDIARRYINPGAGVTRLLFPMVRDQATLDRQYRANFEKIVSVIDRGDDAALLTIGDPATYSTSWPILTLIRDHASHLSVHVVPGITSYAAGAARGHVQLVDGNENVTVVSSYDDPERIAAAVDASDNIVFLKTYRQRDTIVRILESRGLLARCIYVKRCGLDGEEIIYDMERLPENLDYFSMIILKKNSCAPA